MAEASVGIWKTMRGGGQGGGSGEELLRELHWDGCSQEGLHLFSLSKAPGQCMTKRTATHLHERP